MSEEFYRWYKRKLDRASVEAPDDLWDSISNRLDDEQDGTRNATKNRRKRVYWFSGMALMLVSTLTVAYLFYNPVKEVYTLANTSVSNPAKKEAAIVSTAIASSVMNATKNNKRETIKKQEKNKRVSMQYSVSADLNMRLNEERETDNAREQQLESTAENTMAVVSSIEMQKIDLMSEKSELIDRTLMIPSSSSVGVDEVGVLVPKPEFDKSNRGFYFGGGVSINNTWLLNKNTYESLNSTDPNTVRVSFTSSKHLTAGFQFNKKNAVQVEWINKSKHSQKYKDYINGHLLNTESDLSYSQFNFLYKRKRALCQGKNIDFAFNKIGGFYYAQLLSAKRIIQSSEYTVERYYQDYNYGVILGLEFETRIKKNWLLLSGVRCDVGLKNIYAGSTYVPASFNKTYTSSVGLNLSLAYIIH